VRRLQPEFPLATLCRVLGVSRSSASYAARPALPDDLSILKTVILHLRVTYRGFGVKRMFEVLKRLRVDASRRQVRQAYVELGILKPRPRPRPRTTNSDHDGPFFENLMLGLTVERPDQVWVADVTYLHIGSRFGYLALLMDVYTRQIVGWSLERFLGARLALQALEMALSTGRHPEIHHSDRDGGYAAHKYLARLRECQTLSSMTKPDSPEENGYAERLNRTVKEEEAYLGEYKTVEEAREAIGIFIQYYNETRIHSALKYQTPFEVLQRWIQEQKERP
jgi:transposase InsO family protein